jgi:protein TonB
MSVSENVYSNERFGFTVFLSTCVHAMVILGAGFTYLEEMSNQPSMEITLAQYASEVAPDDADFLAQENQTGSGTLDESAAPSTPFESEFNDNSIQEVATVQQTVADTQNALQDIVVLTTNLSEEEIAQQLEDELAESEEPQADLTTPENISMAIASLQAQLDLQRQAYAKKPRTYTISSASTQKSHDALYLDSWRKRIESVGNLNYPDSARRQNIYGSLRLLVTIFPDGSLKDVEILQSSSSRILDQAAVDIVNMAAPFEPFPAELRGEVDILEIIRTWRFHEGDAFSSD